MRKAVSLLISLSLLAVLLAPPDASARTRKRSKKRTVLKILGLSAAGAGVGALIGGKRGAVAGAAIGGGAGALHSYARRRSGHSRRTKTIGTIAGATALGAGIGAAIGGKKGAGVGALLGGGGSAFYSFARKRSGFGRTGRTIGLVGGGAAAGTGLGLALGGGKGAGIGALLGGGGSALYALTRDNDEEEEYRSEYRPVPRRDRAVTYREPSLGVSNALYGEAPYDNNRYDSYDSMSGLQGAGIGRLLAEGSNSFGPHSRRPVTTFK